jgi:hypothetical protein
MTPEEEQAASDERVNEAALGAEDLYRWLLCAPEEDALDYLRAALRLQAQADEFNASRRAGLTLTEEVSPHD